MFPYNFQPSQDSFADVANQSRSVIAKNISLNQYDPSHSLQPDLTPYFDFYSLEKLHPPKYTLFFLFRGLVIGTNHIRRKKSQ